MRHSESVNSHRMPAVQRGICAAGHALAAEAGVRAMQQGGNAVDALVAAAFTAFVVEPAWCGLGGYGHFSVYLAARDEFVSFDAYGRAPGAARADMFEADRKRPATYYGHPHTEGGGAERGYLAPMVPGSVAGCCDAHEAFGKLRLAAVLEPAIEAARAGVAFTWHAALCAGEQLEHLARFPDTSAALLPGGNLPRVLWRDDAAERLDTAALARTLQRIAARGKRAFYTGKTARDIARYVQAGGGILSESDLAGFETRVLREPPARYRGHAYVSCDDQVAYEALNILDHFDLRRYGPDDYAYRHLVAEALAAAFTDSMTHYGDLDFSSSPVNGLASPGLAGARRKQLRLRTALRRPVAPADPWRFETEVEPPAHISSRGSGGRICGTSQVAVADRHGNMASACISIGGPFGSLVYVPEVGIFLNNAMQNFDPRPGHPNSIAPGKRPIFAAPAIVVSRRGEARFAASGSGGYRIETGVLHTLINLLDHRMSLQQAVDHPRVHCQGQETLVDSRVPGEVCERLARAGHQVCVVEEQPGSWNFGRVCAVARDPRRKTLSGAAGPAWATAIAGY